MKAFYNEIDAYCCAWLSNLMDAGHITPGVICDKSIEDLIPDELRGYDRVHMFAGIGGWDYALNLAGWGTREVWTGSCPCQPFSSAGKGLGFEDERHLWPNWQHLISQCDPAVVFGEQVASATQWLGLVCGDMEAMGRAVGFNHIEAASAGADHRRDRIFFVADTRGTGLAKRERERGVLPTLDGESQRQDVADDGGIVGYANGANGQRGAGTIAGTKPAVGGEDGAVNGDITHRSEHAGEGGTMADADCERGISWSSASTSSRYGNSAHAAHASSDRNPSAWIIGHDGKARRIEPSIRLLADGIPARVGKLRALGNAIDPRPAAVFIRAYCEARGISLMSKEKAA